MEEEEEEEEEGTEEDDEVDSIMLRGRFSSREGVLKERGDDEWEDDELAYELGT